MKKTRMTKKLLILLTSGMLCATAMQAQAAAATEKELSVDIKGMTCAGCASGAADAVKELKGITSAKVNFDRKTGVFVYDSSKVTEKQIVAAINKLGYQASAKQAVTSVALKVDGLACPFCVNGLEKQLKRVPGIGSLTTDLKTGTVRLPWGDGVPPVASFSNAVRRAGFTLRRTEVRIAGVVEKKPKLRLRTKPGAIFNLVLAEDETALARTVRRLTTAETVWLSGRMVSSNAVFVTGIDKMSEPKGKP